MRVKHKMTKTQAIQYGLQEGVIVECILRKSYQNTPSLQNSRITIERGLFFNGKCIGGSFDLDSTD